MVCLIYGSDQTSCIGYLSIEAITTLIVIFIIFWGLTSMFKIILRLMGF